MRSLPRTCVALLALAAGSSAQEVTPQDPRPRPASQPTQVNATAEPRTDGADRPLHIGILGGTIGEGLTWNTLEGYCPDPDPRRFAREHLGRYISRREYELRTDNIPFGELMSRVLSGRPAVAESGPDGSTAVSDSPHSDTDAVPAPRAIASVFAASSVLAAPEMLLRRQLRNAKRAGVDIAIGVDFALWMGYGPVSARVAADSVPAQRFARQADMFAMIDEELTGTSMHFVVGDYPDLTLVPTLLIPPASRPTARTLAELNERLHAFATKRPQVTVFSVARPLDQANRGELTVDFQGETHKLRVDQLTQLDRVHPNRLGTAFLTARVLEFGRAQFDWFARSVPALTFEQLVPLADASLDQLDELDELCPVDTADSAGK